MRAHPAKQTSGVFTPAGKSPLASAECFGSPTQRSPERLNLLSPSPGCAPAFRRQLLGASLWFFFLALWFAAVGSALGSDGAPVSDPARFHFPGWLASLAAFVGTARLAVKFFQPWLQSFFTALIARVHDSQERDDDALLEKLFASLWYRALAFLADYLLSLKLPTSTSLDIHRSETPKS